MAKVWSKRFDNTLNPFIEKFNASIGFDRKLILEDLDCSIAHAKMLGKTQVLSSSETLQILKDDNKLFEIPANLFNSIRGTCLYAAA